MSLDEKDLETIEKMFYKNCDDFAIALGRSFERLEERVDSIESRIYTRLIEIEEKVEDSRQTTIDILEAVREDIRALHARE